MLSQRESMSAAYWVYTKVWGGAWTDELMVEVIRTGQ